MNDFLTVFAVVLVIISLFVFNDYAVSEQTTQAMESKAGFDMKVVEHGRYLSMISGCNDCHTSGYLMSSGKVPQEKWLTGDSFGWRGPWGTTYATNLRLVINEMTEQQWLEFAKTLQRRPPMPWYTVNIMTDEDLKAFYQFVKYLGPAGEPAPAYVPPDQEPTTPYALFPAPPE